MSNNNEPTMTPADVDRIFNGVGAVVNMGHEVYNAFAGVGEGNPYADSRRNLGYDMSGFNQYNGSYPPPAQPVSYGYGYASTPNTGFGGAFNNNVNAGGYPGFWNVNY